MRTLPYVIDNDKHRMADTINQVLTDHRELAMDIASAYFNIGGYRLLGDRMKELGSLRLLLGHEPESGEDIGLIPRGDALEAFVRGDMSRLPFRPETIALVEDLIRFLQRESVKVRQYDKKFLHAKCYLFYGDPKGGPLFDRFRPVLGIVGSSNFTAPGLTTNRELNLVHKGIMPEEEVEDKKARAAALSHYSGKNVPIEEIGSDAYDGGAAPRVGNISFDSKRILKSEVGAAAIWELADWFESHWAESRDYKQQLIDLLDASKFGTKQYSPYDVYLKALFEHFRADLGDGAEQRSDLYTLNLAEFQDDAVARARRILAKYDGVMVCDSVGLGKTWIGLQLLLDYAYHKRHHALIVCPAALREMWQSRLHQTKIQAQVLGQEALGREDFDVDPYSRSDVIVVDESHNFRNKASGRYDNLSRLLALNGGRGEHGYRKKIILLTATPINNGVRDLHHQMQFLTRGDNAFFAAAGIGKLDKYFQVAHRQLMMGTGSVGRALYNLLDEVVIRRTRQYIKKAYPNATIDGEKIHFPTRKLVTVKYDLEGTYAGIYEKVVRGIENLKLAPYDLEEYKADPKAKDSMQIGRGQALVGIFKSRYLKRLESSVAAFRISIFRLMEYMLTFRHYILDDVLLEPTDFWKLLGTIEKDLEDDAKAQEEDVEDDDESATQPISRHKQIEANPKATHLLRKMTRLPPKTYALQRLNDALDADLAALQTIYDLIRPIRPEADKKLLRLREILQGDLRKKKVLIFTSYKDTARYLFKQISEDTEFVEKIGNPSICEIHGGTDSSSRLRIVQAFAPHSNDKAGWAGTDKEIDVLFSTDVLSEGQNLQDCAYLVNYDLHWNPTRMIQRAGRIDRIGAKFNTLFVRNFFPDEGLERLLGLVQSLQDKIKTIDATVGLDASVLGEAINPKVFNTIKRIEGEDSTVMDEEEADAELATDEGLVRHIVEFLKTTGADALRRLPDGIHSGLHKRGFRGIFFYYQSIVAPPVEPQHFWRFYHTETGEIDDNRLALAELIRCKPDEPRLVDPALKSDIHEVMARVEKQIVDGLNEQTSIELAPKDLSPEQSKVRVALQQLLNAQGVDRSRVISLMGSLSQPLGAAPVKELKKALAQFQAQGLASSFLGACEAVASNYSSRPTTQGAKLDRANRTRLTRDSLRLICFDFIS